MTSTKFNIGMDEGRKSSRVLRPPGGGHTDIFGAEPLPVKKDNGRNASSIIEGTNVAAPVVKAAVPAAAPPPVVTPSANEAPAAASRGRVPPGGFSSGLW